MKKSHNSTFPLQFAKDADDFKSQLIIRLTLHIFGLFCAVPLKGIQSILRSQTILQDKIVTYRVSCSMIGLVVFGGRLGYDVWFIIVLDMGGHYIRSGSTIVTHVHRTRVALTVSLRSTDFPRRWHNLQSVAEWATVFCKT